MSSGSKHRIAILASGTGTNTRALLQYFAAHPSIDIAVVGADRHAAGALEMARRYKVPDLYLPAAEWDSGQALARVQAFRVSWIVLAGFLKLLPPDWIQAFQDRIVNIHPALLPRFGGKGMYGHHVHTAVSEAGAAETGITIHWVNEVYDAGAVVVQYKVAIEPFTSPAAIAKAVQRLEHQYFPPVVEALVLGQPLPE